MLLSLLGDGVGFHPGLTALAFIIEGHSHFPSLYGFTAHQFSTLHMFLTPSPFPPVSPQKNAERTLFFFFGCTCGACWILLPRAGIKPVLPAVEVQSLILGHQEVPGRTFNVWSLGGLSLWLS